MSNRLSTILQKLSRRPKIDVLEQLDTDDYSATATIREAKKCFPKEIIPNDLWPKNNPSRSVTASGQLSIINFNGLGKLCEFTTTTFIDDKKHSHSKKSPLTFIKINFYFTISPDGIMSINNINGDKHCFDKNGIKYKVDLLPTEAVIMLKSLSESNLGKDMADEERSQIVFDLMQAAKSVENCRDIQTYFPYANTDPALEFRPQVNT